MVKLSPIIITGIIFIVIAIIITVTSLSRTRKNTKISEPEVPGDGKPVLDLNGAQLILKPNKPESFVSEYELYKTEYAVGDLGSTSGANIDLLIRWSTGKGITENNVSKFVFRRFLVENGNKREISKPIIIDDSDKLVNFRSDEATFLGSDLNPGETGVGDNHIKAYYKIPPPGGFDNEMPFTETEDVVNITQAELDSTLNLTEVKVLEVPVTTGGDDSLSGSVDLKPDPYTTYVIESKEPGFMMRGIRMKAIDNGKIQFMTYNGTNWGNFGGAGTGSFLIEKYNDFFLILKGEKKPQGQIQPVWIWTGGGDEQLEAAGQDIMVSSFKFDRALFTIKSETYNENILQAWHPNRAPDTAVTSAQISTWSDGVRLGGNPQNGGGGAVQVFTTADAPPGMSSYNERVMWAQNEAARVGGIFDPNPNAH